MWQCSASIVPEKFVQILEKLIFKVSPRIVDSGLLDPSKTIFK